MLTKAEMIRKYQKPIHLDCADWNLLYHVNLVTQTNLGCLCLLERFTIFTNAIINTDLWPFGRGLYINMRSQNPYDSAR